MTTRGHARGGLSAGALASALSGRLERDGPEVRRVAAPPAPSPAAPPAPPAAPPDALAGAVTVCPDAISAERSSEAGAAALVLPEGIEAPPPRADGGPALVRVADARLALARATALFDARPPVASGRHAGAAPHPDARLGESVALGPGAVIAAGARLGDGCRIGPNAVIGEGAVLGPGCAVHAGAVLRDGVRLGARVTVHANAVIGADGFGYVPGPRGAEKIRHLGGVEIGDDAEIGACTAIDRGTLGDTVIGARVKIDNHCQIGHNVRIGDDALIAGMTGISGSVRIGRGAVLGGAVGVADHVTIGDGARIAGRSGVTKDVPAGETWAGFPARPYAAFARRQYLLGRLERIWAFVRAGEGADARAGSGDDRNGERG